MKLLTYNGVAPMLHWDDAVEALRAGHTLGPPDLGDLLLGPADALLLNRAAYIAEIGYAVKVETVIPGNTRKNLPSLQGVVILHDPEDGSVRAVIESRLVTEYKTAADSVLGAQLLARPDSRHLLIAGAGPVAGSLTRAYSAIFPTLERISIWARRPERAEALIDSLTDVEADLAVVADLKTTVQVADIISTATSAREPILFGDWVQPGAHVDLIGAFTPEMREADDTLMAKAQVYVDFRDTTIDVAGDLTQSIGSGAITAEDVRGDLYDLTSAEEPARRDDADITLFKNGGGAHLDLMIAAYVVRSAE